MTKPTPEETSHARAVGGLLHTIIPDGSTVYYVARNMQGDEIRSVNLLAVSSDGLFLLDPMLSIYVPKLCRISTSKQGGIRTRVFGMAKPEELIETIAMGMYGKATSLSARRLV